MASDTDIIIQQPLATEDTNTILRATISRLDIRDAGEDPLWFNDAEWFLTIRLESFGNSTSFSFRDLSVHDGDRVTPNMTLAVPLTALVDYQNRTLATANVVHLTAFGRESDFDEGSPDDDLPRIDSWINLPALDGTLSFPARNSDFRYTVTVALDVNEALLSEAPQRVAALTDPVTSVYKSGDQQIDSLLSGTKWGGSVGTGATITYSFAGLDAFWVRQYSVGDEPHNGFQPLNQAQQDAVRLALQTWSRVANLNFVEIPESRDQVGMMRFGVTDYAADTIAGAAAYPGHNQSNGDVWLDADTFTPTANLQPGTSNFKTIMHEIGHALGLKHPHDSTLGTIPGDPGAGSDVITTDDWQASSVMSYRQYPGQPDPLVSPASLDRYPTTPMPRDMRAIQYLYGTNLTATAGDDTYTIPADVLQRPFATIVDTAGNDTLDAGSAIRAVTISLMPGTASQIGPPVRWTGPDALSTGSSADTVYIANAIIENAKGSFGADRINGNPSANRLDGFWGDDTLDGAAGNDTLVGGERGSDTFRFAADTGSDTILDFHRGEDLIAIADFAIQGRFLLFEDMDTVADGTLDDADAQVAVSDVSGDAIADTVLDLTPFAPQGSPSVLALLGVSGLDLEDFG
jgi:hypothetical protein